MSTSSNAQAAAEPLESDRGKGVTGTNPDDGMPKIGGGGNDPKPGQDHGHGGGKDKEHGRG